MNDILDDLLPTKWARRVAVTTLTAALAAPFLYEGLQKLGIEIETLKAPSVRLLLGAVFAIAGLLTLLVLVLRYAAELNVQLRERNVKPTEVEAKVAVRLDSIQENLLLLLCKLDDVTSAEIAEGLGVGEQLVTYHMTELENRRLVHGSYSGIDATQWSIIQGGRAYLARHDLLK